MMKSVARWLVPCVLLGLSVRSPRRLRLVALVTLVGVWLRQYVRYRATGLRKTRTEYDRLRTVRPEAYSRHYNERVPTVEEELEEWGPYHRHRHEMRYKIVAAAVRRHVPRLGRVLDVGCGSMNVADRLQDLDIRYVGVDYGDPHIRYAIKKYASVEGPMRVAFARCDASSLPLAPGSMDVVIMSEVIEHLVRPELAVWEISRVLRPGGVLVLTTNNASEVPLMSPLWQPFAWVEKAVGADVPALISHRVWVWPEKVHPDLLPDGSGDVYLPHTHHIVAETKRMLDTAGLATIEWSTFEFPPPHSRTAAILSRLGAAGRFGADVIESVAQSLPLIRRLGTHLFLVAQKTHAAVASEPPSGVWPGPFSGDDGELRRLRRAGWPAAARH